MSVSDETVNRMSDLILLLSTSLGEAWAENRKLKHELALAEKSPRWSGVWWSECGDEELVVIARFALGEITEGNLMHRLGVDRPEARTRVSDFLSCAVENCPVPIRGVVRYAHDED